MVSKTIWIDGYEGLYSIDIEGNIYSMPRKKGFIMSKLLKLKQSKDTKGYYKVTLCLNEKHKTLRVHRLLMKAFVPNPERNFFVNHKDGDKANNALSNLEWCTKSEDVQHAHDTGLNKSRFSQKQKNAVRNTGFKNRTISSSLAKKIKQKRKETGYGGRKLSKIFETTKGIVDGIIYRDCYKEVEA